MPIGDMWRVSCIGRLHNQAVINNWYYRRTGGAADDTMAEALSLKNGWMATVRTAWLDVHSNEYTLESLLERKIWQDPPPVPVEFAIGEVGSIQQNSLPTSVAVVLRKRTDYAGPRFRGRIFLAGVPISFETDSTITPAAQNDYNDLGAALKLGFTQGLYSWIPVHVTGITWFEIVSVTCDVVLRSQRRRQVGRGI